MSGADPLRVAEADELTKTLSGLGIGARVYVANRVHVSTSVGAQPRLGRADVEAALPSATDATVEALARAQDIRASLARRDRIGLARLAEIAGPERLLVVPELDDEVGDRAAIEHLLEALLPKNERTST